MHALETVHLCSTSSLDTYICIAYVTRSKTASSTKEMTQAVITIEAMLPKDDKYYYNSSLPKNRMVIDELNLIMTRCPVRRQVFEPIKIVICS